MTVKELIDKLQSEYPPDLEVELNGQISDFDHYRPLEPNDLALILPEFKLYIG